ncbi:uncharacterized protein LOC123685953 [Harmonia axyridis]|uniref:uncharacterized protein LOC123685953 n=1 Tax=Harmonia axyridis TaxID=115357 RepID=UPI001E27710F|nr:uncharacterized protein LOC123685953 [Harmonia axyridis]
MRRLLPNIGGPSYFKRRVLCTILHSVLLYAAPVWRAAIKRDKQKLELVKMQRRGLLRVVCAYRTVSAEAVQVIAGYPPIDLIFAETCFLYKIGSRLPGNRRMAKKRTIRMWQTRWEAESRTAGWTRTLIGDLEGWMACEHRRTGYYFTQFLTGHGSFGTYTKRIKKTESDQCQRCGMTDDPEHVYGTCVRWEEERSWVRSQLQRLPDINSLITEMTESKKTWTVMYEYITNIMKRKEEEDRRREQQAGP